MSLLLWIVFLLLLAIPALVFLVKRRKKLRGSGYSLDAEKYHKKIAERLVKSCGPNEFYQLLPLHSSKGWSMYTVSNGLRVHHQLVQNLPGPHPLSTQHHPILAASLILDMSVKRSLAVASYVEEFSSWYPGWLPGTQRLTDSSTSPRQLMQINYSHPESEVEKVYKKVKGWSTRHAPFLRQLWEFLPAPTPSNGCGILEMYPHKCEAYAYVFDCPRDSWWYVWSCLVLTSLQQEGTTLATLLLCPSASGGGEDVCARLTGRLCGLRQYITMRRFKVYSGALLAPSLSTKSQGNPTNTQDSFHSHSHNSTHSVHGGLSRHSSSSSSVSLSQRSTGSSSLRTQGSSSHRMQGSSLRAQGSVLRPPGSSPDLHRSCRQDSDGRGITIGGGGGVSGNRNEDANEDGSHGDRAERSQNSEVEDIGEEEGSTDPSVTVAGNTSGPLAEGLTDMLLPNSGIERDEGGAHYLGMVKDLCEEVLAAEAGGEVEGWVSLGRNKDVEIHKKPPSKGVLVGCFKGTGTINAPPEFLLRLLDDPSRASELDDMMKEARPVGEVCPGIHVVQLIYKAVWPTSARDFCMLSVSGKLRENVWLSLAKSVEDSRVPPEKNYVRACLAFGGYVIRGVAAQPEQSVVTYAGSVDLRGSIPSFVMNKVTESQPLCVNSLRKVGEPLYQQLKTQPHKLQEFQEQFPIFPLQTQCSPTGGGGAGEGGADGGGRRENGAGGGGGGEGGAGEGGDNGSSEACGDRGVACSQGEVTASDGSGSPDMASSTLEERLGNSQWHYSPAPLSPASRETDLTTTITLAKPPDCVMGNNSASQEGVGFGKHDFTTPVDSEEGTSQDSSGTLRKETSQGGSGSLREETKTEDRLLGGASSGLLSGMRHTTLREETKTEDRLLGGASSGSLSGKRRTHSDSQASSSSASMGSSQSEPQLKSRTGSLRTNSAPQESPAMKRRWMNGQSPRPDSSVKQQDGLSLTRDFIDYPRNDLGEVDYRTLANQTAAHVLQEVFHVGGVDISDPSSFSNLSGGWKYEGVEKDTVILSMDGGPNRPFTSFIGKGIIPLSPTLVFESLRNPNLRFTYDNMLKELHIVQQMEKDLFIMHVHHETTQCFVKQSRDFCILVSERSEQSKKLLVGTSIETSLCPPNNGIYRGRVYCSGWVVQPRLVKGKLHTDITYILQVDLGSGVPKTILNLISKRQPLAVAYLRDYLVSTSLEASVQS